jgi:hypothetical protein
MIQQSEFLFGTTIVKFVYIDLICFLFFGYLTIIFFVGLIRTKVNSWKPLLATTDE